MTTKSQAKAEPEKKEGEPEEQESNRARAERAHKANREAIGDAVPPWPHDDVGPENPEYLPENLNTLPKEPEEKG